MPFILYESRDDSKPFSFFFVFDTTNSEAQSNPLSEICVPSELVFGIISIKIIVTIMTHF